MKKVEKNNKSRMFAYSSLGLVFPVSIAVGLFIGYFLDSFFNTAPILLIIFTLYGVAAGFYNFFKVIKKNEK